MRAAKVQAANTWEACRAAARWLAWVTGGTASARRQMLRARLFLCGLALIVAAGSWLPAPTLAQFPAGDGTEVGGRPLLGRGWGVGSGVPGALPAAGTATLGYPELAPRALVAVPGVGWVTPSECPDPAATVSSAGPFCRETAGHGSGVFWLEGLSPLLPGSDMIQQEWKSANSRRRRLPHTGCSAQCGPVRMRRSSKTCCPSTPPQANPCQAFYLIYFQYVGPLTDKMDSRKILLC